MYSTADSYRETEQSPGHKNLINLHSHTKGLQMKSSEVANSCHSKSVMDTHRQLKSCAASACIWPGPALCDHTSKKVTAMAHLEGKDVCGDGLALQGFPGLQLQLVHCSLASPTGSLEAVQQALGASQVSGPIGGPAHSPG